jgi:hypothetical protein
VVVSVPVIFAVDEDEGALRAVERELVDRYSRGYRVICVSSEEEAMAQLRHGSMNRVASAVGEGSIAIKLVYELFAAEQLQLN